MNPNRANEAARADGRRNYDVVSVGESEHNYYNEKLQRRDSCDLSTPMNKMLERIRPHSVRINSR